MTNLSAGVHRGEIDPGRAVVCGGGFAGAGEGVPSADFMGVRATSAGRVRHNGIRLGEAAQGGVVPASHVVVQAQFSLLAGGPSPPAGGRRRSGGCSG